MARRAKFPVELVLCIDATGSMSPVIGKVKRNALQLYDDLQHLMEERGRKIGEMRARVIVYRDYYCDGGDAMEGSPFYALPQDRERFAGFVQPITASGGGDEPESGLEAIALAIGSDWSTTGYQARQVIVLWTDASAHPLEMNAGAKPRNYPAHMPENLEGLTALWQGQDYLITKRLILFAPPMYPWVEMAKNWSCTWHYQSQAGQGLSELDYGAFLSAIAGSIGLSSGFTG